MSNIRLKTGNNATNCIISNKNFATIGNLIPHDWYHKITTKKGGPDLISIAIFSEIFYWYRPKAITDNETGAKKYINKFCGDIWQTSYNHFQKKFNFSHETIRRSLVKLEQLGLIKRELRTISLRGQLYANVLFIHLNLQAQNLFKSNDDVDTTCVNQKVSSTRFFEAEREAPYPQIVGDHIIDIKNKNYKDRSIKSNFFEKNSEDLQNLQESMVGAKLINVGEAEYHEESFTKTITAIEPFNTTSKSKNWHKNWFRKSLSDFHPLNEEDAEVLTKESGRVFNLNFINQLLLRLSEKYPDRKFYRKKSFIVYMTKVLSNEMRQTTQVNNEDFKFKKEGSEYEVDKYLEEVEYSRDTSKEAQFRRKVAAVFDQDTAYKLLFNSKFEIKQESKENDEEETSVLYIKLSEKILLTELQKTILLEQGKAVYGDIEKLSLLLSNNLNMPGKYLRIDQDQLCEMDQKTVWGKVRLALQSYYGVGVDKAWFGKLIAEENKSNNVLTLKAPTAFIRDWIQQHYYSIIEQFCEREKYQLQVVEVI